MRVLIKKVNEDKCEVKEIENKLEEYQSIVGGWIECVYLMNDIILVCNEEGKLMDLDPNFALEDMDIICGDVFFVGDGEEDFESITDEQIAFIEKNMGPNSFIFRTSN